MTDDDAGREHMRRIGLIMDRWHRGELSTSQKRASIAAENLGFYGGHIKSPSTGESLTATPKRGDSSVGLLADAAGVPFEAMAAALSARRRANYEAATHAETMDESREMITSGFESYRALIKAAKPSGAARIPDRAVPPEPLPGTRPGVDW